MAGSRAPGLFGNYLLPALMLIACLAAWGFQLSNITGARAAVVSSLLIKEMPARERQHTGGQLPLEHTNSFGMALQVDGHFVPILSSEHTNRVRSARRTRMAIELADVRYTPHRTLNTTSIEQDNESGGAVTNNRSRSALFAIAVSGDTFLTWQKN